MCCMCVRHGSYRSVWEFGSPALLPARDPTLFSSATETQETDVNIQTRLSRQNACFYCTSTFWRCRSLLSPSLFKPILCFLSHFTRRRGSRSASCDVGSASLLLLSHFPSSLALTSFVISPPFLSSSLWPPCVPSPSAARVSTSLFSFLFSYTRPSSPSLLFLSLLWSTFSLLIRPTLSASVPLLLFLPLFWSQEADEQSCIKHSDTASLSK